MPFSQKCEKIFAQCLSADLRKPIAHFENSITEKTNVEKKNLTIFHYFVKNILKMIISQFEKIITHFAIIFPEIDQF